MKRWMMLFLSALLWTQVVKAEAPKKAPAPKEPKKEEPKTDKWPSSEAPLRPGRPAR